MQNTNFTFHEAMKDSPNFRYELGQSERYFDRLHKRMEDGFYGVIQETLNSIFGVS
uniref:Cytosolic protein n=1 Tax=Meloidogyne hapla TaxID=6305 RepID=A0A1I8BLS6_MELHA